MKKSIFNLLFLSLLIFTIFSGVYNGNYIKVPTYAYAADTSAPPSVNDIEITNNSGTADTIDVVGLSPGDIVYVYKVATGGKYIVQKTVPLAAEEVTLSVPQLGSAGGSIYVSVKTPGMLESPRSKVTFSPESKTAALSIDNISITNNAGKTDSIFISDLSVGDTIKVYSSATGRTQIGTGKVSSSKSDLNIKIQQIGINSGSIYISVTSVGKLESPRTKVDFQGESKSEAPSIEGMIISNNAGKADTIYLCNVNPGDTIKIYSALTGGKLLASQTVSANKYEVTLSIQQLGLSSGSLYISLTSDGMLQSDKVKVDYSSENKSQLLASNQIAITNNAGKADNIKISGLTDYDLIKVYDSEKGLIPIGTGSAAFGATEVNISVRQLGATNGSVYISLTGTNKLESGRVKVDYTAEEKSASPLISNMEVVNNAGIQDTVKVNYLSAADVVKVYDALEGGKLLGSATALANSTQVTIAISQLGTEAGDLYVSVTGQGKTESNRTKISYLAEAKSSVIGLEDITIQNNAGISDKITVIDLAASDVIKVYSSSTGDTLLGSGTVGTDSNEVSITIKQIGVNAGSVYISVKKYGKIESDRIKADFIAEPTALLASSITVDNNVLISDTIKVVGLSYNDIIKVYDAATGGNMLGLSKVPANTTDIVISVPQLGTSIGSVYVSVTHDGMGESIRTKVDYSAEQVSNPIFVGNVQITNNKGSSDSITVSNLTSNDVVKVYDAEKGGVLISTGNVPTNGTQVTISIPQLGASGGSIYISVTSAGKNESIRVKIGFVSEP